MNIQILIRLIAVVISSITFSTLSFASPITWTFQNASFEDGSALIGSFDYDATTNIYSNLNFETEASSIDYRDMGAIYTDQHTLILPTSNSTQFEINQNPDVTTLFISFLTPLTNNGGTVHLNETNSWEFNLYFNHVRYLSDGAYISSTPSVPVPAAVWLFSSGLICLIGVARRKKA